MSDTVRDKVLDIERDIEKESMKRTAQEIQSDTEWEVDSVRDIEGVEEKTEKDSARGE